MSAVGPARRRLLKGAAGLAAGAALPGGGARATVEALPLRTITAGVPVDAAQPTAAIGRARHFLTRARSLAETAGFEVQTVRIATPPHARYLAEMSDGEALDLAGAMRRAAGEVEYLALGPGLLEDRRDAAVVDRLVGLALRGLATTVVLGDRASGVHRRAVRVAAAVVRALADAEPAANFNFAGIANVAPGVPYFPGAYHDGGPACFAIGTEAAALFMRVCAETRAPQRAEPALARTYDAALGRVEALGRRIARETGWHYAGIDPTPAQWGERSIGTAVEHLTGAPFGAPGTLAACRMLTRAVRAVTVRTTGYRGLFLPPMEDTTLARRAYDYYGLDALLAYSAVCGTGLDTVALPGDASEEELARILGDVATLAVRLDKPLTGRLLPLPGKAAGESSGPVGDLFPMKVLALGRGPRSTRP